MKLEILESVMTTAIPREIVSRVRGQVGKKKQIMGPFDAFRILLSLDLSCRI